MGTMCSKVREKDINSLMEHSLALQRELAIKEVDLENTKLKLNEYKKSFDRNNNISNNSNSNSNSKKKPQNNWHGDIDDLNSYKKNMNTAYDIRNIQNIQNRNIKSTIQKI